MSSQLNLVALPEPDISARGGRRKEESAGMASVSRSKRLTNNQVAGQTLASRACAPTLEPIAVADRPASATDSTEIAMDQLCTNDQVVIQTAHSTYIFLVIDARLQIGQVVGGVFGDYAVDALLEILPQSRQLRVGGQALFHIKSNGGHKRVTTSAITHLIHRKKEPESTRQD